jgi:hypothetical protein
MRGLAAPLRELFQQCECEVGSHPPAQPAISELAAHIPWARLNLHRKRIGPIA